MDVLNSFDEDEKEARKIQMRRKQKLLEKKRKELLDLKAKEDALLKEQQRLAVLRKNGIIKEHIAKNTTSAR